MGLFTWSEKPSSALQGGGVIGPDERLPWAQTGLMGVQHVIAMFGSTVLAPILMGFDPNLAVLMSGIGTLIFFLITGGKVPSYLGSSFAFIGVVIAATGYAGQGANANIGLALGGTTLARPFLDGRTMVQAGHRRAKFVVYPIEPVRPDGLQRINWICDRRLREDGFGGGLTAPSREDWSKPGSLDDLLPTFGSWRFAWLDVPGLIRAAEQILEWPMVDRDPLPRWRHGHTTLLGDAAHPMYPIGSNGATQAILDAAALADALDGHASITAALNAYEAARLPMTRDIVAMNRREGLDAILDMVEEAAPEGFARIEDVTDPTVLAEWVQAYKKAAGHQVGRPQAAH